MVEQSIFVYICIFLICYLLGCLTVGLLLEYTTPIQITSEAGNEICRNITQNNNSNAISMFGKLQCNIPSKNKTIESNIIIKEMEK